MAHRRYRFLLLMALTASLNAAENYIESTAGAAAMGLGLLEIRPVSGPALADDPNIILQQDLEWPGRFRVITSRRIDSLLWVREQAYSYVFGNYRQFGDSLELTLGLTDLISMEPVAAVGGKFRIHKNHLRAAVHRFSDQLVAQYYGEPGVASSRVVFVRRSNKDLREVWMMDYDGARQRQVTRDGNIAMMPSWSAEGSSIFYTSFLGGYPHLRVIEEGKKQSCRLLPAGIHAYGAKANPDGERLVYSRQEQGSNDLWIYNLKSGAQKQLTYHPATETSPEWAPNGWSIAFTSDRGGRPQLYTIEADGTGEERLTFISMYVESAAWSPQGDKIAYCAMVGGRFDLFVLNIGTGETIQLTQGGGNDEAPSWSADGRLIMFASDRTGISQLYLVRPDGTGLVQLTRDKESGAAPRWSPRRSK